MTKRPKARKSTWVRHWDRQDWKNKSDMQIAEELGIRTSSQVAMVRRRRQYPKGPNLHKPETWTPTTRAWMERRKKKGKRTVVRDR